MWSEPSKLAICAKINSLSNSGQYLRYPYCIKRAGTPRCGDGQVDVGEQCDVGNPNAPNNTPGCCDPVTCQWLSGCSVTTYKWSAGPWSMMSLCSTENPLRQRIVSCLNNLNQVQSSHTRNHHSNSFICDLINILKYLQC
jgi:hypothetical protein